MKVSDIENIKKLTGNELTGIYFLIDKDLVVYVGQSHNIKHRMIQHNKEKVFDNIYYFECPESELNELEAKYIGEFNPSYNKTHVFVKELYLARKQNKPNKKKEKESLLIKTLLEFLKNIEVPCKYCLFEIKDYLLEKTNYKYTDKQIINFLDDRHGYKIYSKYRQCKRWASYIWFEDINKYLRRTS